MTILCNFQNSVRHPLHSICLQTHLAKISYLHLVALTKIERKERTVAAKEYLHNSNFQHRKYHFHVSAEGPRHSEIPFTKRIIFILINLCD